MFKWSNHLEFESCFYISRPNTYHVRLRLRTVANMTTTKDAMLDKLGEPKYHEWYLKSPVTNAYRLIQQHATGAATSPTYMMSKGPGPCGKRNHNRFSLRNEEPINSRSYDDGSRKINPLTKKTPETSYLYSVYKKKKKNLSSSIFLPYLQYDRLTQHPNCHPSQQRHNQHHDRHPFVAQAHS